MFRTHGTFQQNSCPHSVPPQNGYRRLPMFFFPLRHDALCWAVVSGWVCMSWEDLRCLPVNRIVFILYIEWKGVEMVFLRIFCLEILWIIQSWDGLVCWMGLLKRWSCVEENREREPLDIRGMIFVMEYLGIKNQFLFRIHFKKMLKIFFEWRRRLRFCC